LPNSIILFVTIDKFDLNLVLVNINKLNPYKFIANKTLQLVLITLNDLVMDDPIQTKEREPLLVEPKDFQPVEFKPINNHLVVLKEQTYLFIIIMMCILRRIM